MNKYFIYARKSTDAEDKQVLSIEAQLTELREYAKREKLTVADELFEAKTAKEPGRLVFNEMVRRLKRGQANAILAWHPDRLARNSMDGGKIIYLTDIEKLVDLRFPTYKFENTAQGKFMLSIIFGQSKYFVDSLSENVHRGFRQKLRRGEYPGFAPLGYKNNTANHTIEIVPEIA
ncbi:MAG: recombinase family protein, partial [Candidatus Omnitrophica bacterium]|nr:recombinase family protein [Candidatus Omnitrophota bacterium]